MDQRLEINRRNWNERTPAHAASAFYDVAGFRAGANTLSEIERGEVGDVAGKTLLHLQCHFGLDTMSWARLGAKATGLDFSDAAIVLARNLSTELGIGTRFVCANVYDAADAMNERFDIVYTAKGVLCWLPDLHAWAGVVARLLKPGGVFYLLEGHPLLDVFEHEPSAGVEAQRGGVGSLRVRYPYFPSAQGEFYPGGEPSYAGTEVIHSGAYEWRHSVSEILTAVQAAGLTLEFFHEFPAHFYQAFPCLQQGEDGWWRFPEGHGRLPQTFSMRARAG